MGCAATHPVTTSVPKSFRSKYSLKHELGKGAYAQVRLCVDRTTHCERAVKLVDTFGEETTKAARELAVWKQVGNHENVVVLLDNYVEPCGYYFVMERCVGALTEMFPLKDNPSCFVDFLGAFQEVFLGLAHCHSMKVVHRDIKSSNLLVTSSGRAKIADFGLSIPMPAEGEIFGLVGSTPFMSPEMVKGKAYGYATDIWSCGALIYSLVYGSYAYDARECPNELPLEERRKKMVKAIATDSPKPLYRTSVGMFCPSSRVRDFIKELMGRSVRPTADSCAEMLSDVKAHLQIKQLQGTASTSSTPKCLKPISECDNFISEDSTRCTDITIASRDTSLQSMSWRIASRI